MTIRTVLAFTLALSLTACGGDGGSDSVEETGAPKTGFGQVLQGAGALKDMAEQMEESANTVPAEPVNHRVLAEMLPEDLDGMPQTETSGETSSMAGFSMSQRSATYANEGEEGQLTVDIMDLGALPNVAMFGAAWAMGIEIDKETGTSYERTITYQGHKGYRKYDTEGRDGELSALIEGRYIVTVKGRDVEDAQLEQALQGVDTRRLASMKDEGRPDA